MTRGIAGLVLAASLGCEVGDFETYPSNPPPCPDARQLDAATCCPAWTAVDDDRCLLRPWQSRPAPSSDPGATDPRVAVDADGRAVVTWASALGGPVWIGDESSVGELLAHRPGAALGGEGLAPTVATDAHGRAMVAWQQRNDDVGAIFVASRRRGGGWQDPGPGQHLSTERTAHAPRVTFGPHDETLVVYGQWTGEVFAVALDRTALGETAPTTSLSSPPGDANAPVVAVAEGGDAVVTWSQAVDGVLRVHIADRRGLHGAWSAPGTVEPLSATADPVPSHVDANPWPAIDAAGRAAIVWTQHGSDGGDVYVATRDGFGTWARPDAALDDPGRTAACARPALSVDGTLHVVWYETATESAPARVMLWRGPLGSPDAISSTSPEPLSSPDTDAIDPSIALGAEGEAVVVYRVRHDGRWQVAARRRQPDNPVWLPETRLSDPAHGEVGVPALALGPNGRTVAVWAAGEPGARVVRMAWIDPAWADLDP
jgi:hypothetical protein